MNLSLSRILLVSSALLLLGLASAAAAVYLFVGALDAHNAQRRGELAVRLLADRVESQLTQLKDSTRRMAQRAAEQGLLGDKQAAERTLFLEQAAVAVPSLLKARLLPVGTREIDSAIPELSYVCLDLLARRERGEKVPDAELHLPGMPSAHIDMLAVVKDPVDEQHLLGHLLLSIDPAALRATLAGLKPADGFAELRQPTTQGQALVVASGGDPALKTGEAPYQQTLAGTDWRLAYWPAAAAWSPTPADLAALGGAVALAVLLLGLSQLAPRRTVGAAIRHDSEVMATLFSDIRTGVLMGQYPFRLHEFRALAKQVRAAGEAMIEDRRELERRSQIDALTGLAARAAFEARLEQLYQQAHTGFTSALLLADIDNLEEINRQIGPEAGDILLKQFARQLRQALRQGDMVAHLEGGRFGVLFPMTDLEKIEPVVQRLRTRLAEEFDPGSGLPRAYSWSAGLTLVAIRDSQSHDALNRADHALQTARNDGGNRTITQMPPA